MIASHVHLSSNVVMRNSYDFHSTDELDWTEADILNVEAVLMSFYENLLADTMRLVQIRTASMKYETLGGKNDWVEDTPLKISELSVTGTRLLEGEALPVGFGNYITQSDLRAGGRSGRIILKFGFTEEMVQASISRWFYSVSADTGRWTDAWTAQNAKPNGNLGSLMAGGSYPDIKLVNLHKGNNIPAVHTVWNSKWLRAYATPRPSVEG